MGNVWCSTSDGITEAHNADRVMFGFARMRDSVASAPQGGALQTLLRSQQTFAGQVEQEDDITLIALNRLDRMTSVGRPASPHLKVDRLKGHRVIREGWG